MSTKTTSQTSYKIIQQFKKRVKNSKRPKSGISKTEWDRLTLLAIIKEEGYPPFYFQQVSKILGINA